MVAGPILLTVLVLAGAVFSRYRAGRAEQARTAHADATEDSMQSFAQTHATEILTGFKVYDQAIADLEGRCAELRNDLTALNRVPLADDDYRNWQQQLETMQDNQARLPKDPQGAYLA